MHLGSRKVLRLRRCRPPLGGAGWRSPVAAVEAVEAGRIDRTASRRCSRALLVSSSERECERRLKRFDNAAPDERPG